MKIIVTGSLGNISGPLTQQLVQKGHSVTVISRNPEAQKDIEALGAQAAIGTVEDAGFLTRTFAGADVVYAMKPPFNIFDKDLDVYALYGTIGRSYAQAILQSGVKKVVHLSSIGGHTEEGIGMLRFHRQVENILNGLPDDVHIKFIRPVGFYNNLFAFVPIIKAQGAIFQNYGGDERVPWVSPIDIADVIAEEIETPFAGRAVRYVASDDASPNEVAAAIGKAIGKPGLKWIAVSDEQLSKGMADAGMNPGIANDWAETTASMGNVHGVLYEDYNRHKPAYGKVKLNDFAQDFAKVYAA